MAVTKAAVTIWQYRIICLSTDAEKAQEQLNFLGSTGWELISVELHQTWHKQPANLCAAILKRPRP